MKKVEELTPGQSLGRYELLAQVARGGMGQVWAARLKGARGFQKLVAIKTLLPELGNDSRIEQMLLEEARIASLIQHPNVVQTTELGEHHGYLYLVMEWLDGESLAFVLKRAEERGEIPLPVAVNLVAQACRGLHAAHELTNDLGAHLGVVHRDVSPHNVLVTHSGVVKLVDFGIAKAMNQDSSFTENGEVKGKYAYMAPEQVLGEEVDRRADVFSIGITLYLMTTGRHPFKTGDKANMIRVLTSDAPAVRPSVHVPGYPPALEAVLMKALEKMPEQRYESAQAMRLALESAVPGAFVPRFEAQVRDYLAKVMGDRAAARREALRRFQLAADERALVDVQVGVLPPMGSQSAGSLRAIMVDNEAGLASVAPPPLAPQSQAPTAPGVRPRSKHRFAFVVAAVGLAAAALAAFKVTRPGAPFGAAASPAPMVTLAAPPAAPPATALAGPVAAAPTALAPSAASSAAPVASASSAPGAGSAAHLDASPSATVAPSPPRTNARGKKARKASSNDLIAPDYAH
jgi:eukaryotic-like serine/threonine-protein kinase